MGEKSIEAMMAVVNISMDTKASVAQSLLLQDIELNTLVLELFYYACIASDREGGRTPLEDIGTSVLVDQISFTNPFNIWAFVKNVPVWLANEVLDRTLFYKSEAARRSAEAGRVKQGEISDKLDNLRKANEIRTELLDAGGNPEEVAKLLGKILYEQGANIEVHDGSRRKRRADRLPFD